VTRAIARCTDLPTPNPQTMAHLHPYVADFAESLLHFAGYVPPGMTRNVHIVPPAIDPLQVSRFDPWKDPVGVIDAYRIVKEEHPEGPLQVEDGVTGHPVDSVEECAARTAKILEDEEAARLLGRRGKEHVRAHHLTPRYLRDYLKIFTEALNGS
jgi:glycosyltransferase involved in cell wall biosynthesis